MNQIDVTIQALGETALSVSFGHSIDPEIHKHVRSLSEFLEMHPFVGFQECILSYTAVTVVYDPFIVYREYVGVTSPAAFVETYIREAISKAKHESLAPTTLISIPVCYGGEYGPDLEFVAESHHMTPEEVVSIHTGSEYLVYMIGFCPGFPYMGGLDERIATPRRQSPRLEIPARSVGIAGMQTGAYPMATPGGWQLIGRAAVELFIPDSDSPSLLKSGDKVRFVSITEQEYIRIRGDAQ